MPLYGSGASSGVSDHGDLTGLADDDHSSGSFAYALADGSRGEFLTRKLGGQAAIVTDTTAGSAQTADLASANVFVYTLDSANCAITLTGATAGSRCVAQFEIHQAASGGTYDRTISFVTSINWPGGTAAQALTGQSAITLFTVWTDDGGTTWTRAFDAFDVRRAVTIVVPSAVLVAGDAKAYWYVPSILNGWRISGVASMLPHSTSTSTVTIQIHNATDAVDVLSTRITIDGNEETSHTATTPAVINTSNDDLATGDKLRIDLDGAGSGPTTELHTEITFSPPA